MLCREAGPHEDKPAWMSKCWDSHLLHVFLERKNEYDGVDEYWVCVKEKGEDVTTEQQEQINESREKAGFMASGTIVHAKTNPATLPSFPDPMYAG